MLMRFAAGGLAVAGRVRPARGCAGARVLGLQLVLQSLLVLFEG